MTYYEAARQVMRNSSVPLTIEEITLRAIADGLLVTHGKTPQASMAAALYSKMRTDPELLKLEERGPGRAKRGSVRWILSSAPSVRD